VANTFVRQFSTNGLHVYVFSTSSASATETCPGPIGKAIVAGLQANIGGTATATTFKYTASSGNCDFSALTATNAYIFMVVTD
jgi:hypothetical protein